MEVPVLFVRDRDAYVATSLSRGPWNPAHANGSAALALLAHCLDDIPTLTHMSMARFTVDLQRPVPVGIPLTVTSQVVREGKKLQVTELALVADGQQCARASALRVREAPVAQPEHLTTGTTHDRPAERITSREQSLNIRDLREEPSGALLAGDILRARRTDSAASATWIRLSVPVVAREAIRTASRMAYAFDFASLVGLEIDLTEVSMINPDVSAHVLRPMVGDWVALTGETRFDHHIGRGVSYAQASDELGVFAVISASQIVERRA